MVVLSNRLCSMETAQDVDIDWDHVNDAPEQLVQDLMNIKKQQDEEDKKEWEHLDPMNTQMHGIITINDNYLNPPPPNPAESLPVLAHPEPIPSPATSSTSLTSTSTSSTNSRISDLSTDDVSLMADKQIPAQRTQSSSPIGALHYSALSLHAMASSIISNSSIETSACEDRGTHHNHRLENDDPVSAQQSKKKRRVPKRKMKVENNQDVAVDTFDVFALEIFKYLLGLDQTK